MLSFHEYIVAKPTLGTFIGEHCILKLLRLLSLFYVTFTHSVESFMFCSHNHTIFQISLAVW
jgi:hypothetical protein